jgi:hypothetical protein
VHVIPRTPYVLVQPTFRFRALTGVAERLPLGGERELALATFIAARLVADVSSADGQTTLRERAAGARHWLMTQALPASARSAFLQLVEAVQRSDSLALAAAWERVMTQAARVLDPAARAELRGIALRPPTPASGPG